ncbi:MAG: DUF4212 domain-containing protein [Rhodobacteraceae bacterium]|nr:DUF4212 domain-containing protein [Paracoccaceae bacterium]
MADKSSHEAHCKAHLRILRTCLLAWFVAALGISLLVAPFLTGLQLFHIDIGHWLAQQGPALAFFVLILVYAWRISLIGRTRVRRRARYRAMRIRQMFRPVRQDHVAAAQRVRTERSARTR